MVENEIDQVKRGLAKRKILQFFGDYSGSKLATLENESKMEKLFFDKMMNRQQFWGSFKMLP